MDLKGKAEQIRESLDDMQLDGVVIVLIKDDQVGSTYAGTKHIDNVIGVIIQFLAGVRDNWIRAQGKTRDIQ